MSKYTVIDVKNGGMKMSVANLGGIIMSLHAPDAKGNYADIVLGCDKPADYLKGTCYFGAIIGRVCNRISGAAFTLDGKKYKVGLNETGFNNSLHGGKTGFDKHLWDICECSGQGWKGVALHRLSPDGEEGYPGNLDVTVFYKLTDDNSLVIEYNAVTDRPTLCSLTQHSYFNLSGGKSKDVLDHLVKIDADYFTPINKKMIPTGEIAKVGGTALDFRKGKYVRECVNSGDALVADVGGGVDHNFVLKNSGCDLVYAASVLEPLSGRQMDVFTTEPAVQLYTGNFVSGKGKGGAVYGKYSGLALETQHTPDSIHHPHFPTVELQPEDTYSTTTMYCFE